MDLALSTWDFEIATVTVAMPYSFHLSASENGPGVYGFSLNAA